MVITADPQPPLNYIYQAGIVLRRQNFGVVYSDIGATPLSGRTWISSTVSSHSPGEACDASAQRGRPLARTINALKAYEPALSAELTVPGELRETVC